jgi:hypothetical protein
MDHAGSSTDSSATGGTGPNGHICAIAATSRPFTPQPSDQTQGQRPRGTFRARVSIESDV